MDNTSDELVDSSDVDKKQLKISIIVLVVFLILTCLYHVKTMQNKKRKPINIKDLNETILVILVSPVNRNTAVSATTKPPMLNTIENLYNNASEPSRISVAAYDMNDHVKTYLPPRLQPSVRVARNMKVLEPKHSSESDARSYLIEKFYLGERYIMTLQSNASIINNWDNILVNLLKSTGSKYSIISGAVVSKNMSNPSKATFLKLDQLKGAKIVTESSVVKEDPIDPVPSLFWTPALSFAAAPAYMNFINGNIISCMDMDITMNTVKLWTSGFNFYTPPLTLAWAVRPEDSNWHRPGKNAVSATATVGNARTFREFENFIGISFNQKKASSRTYSGLTNSVTAFEAGVKVGSLEAARLADTKKVN